MIPGLIIELPVLHDSSTRYRLGEGTSGLVNFNTSNTINICQISKYILTGLPRTPTQSVRQIQTYSPYIILRTPLCLLTDPGEGPSKAHERPRPPPRHMSCVRSIGQGSNHRHFAHGN